MIQGLVVNLSSVTQKVVIGEVIPSMFIVTGGGDKFSSGRITVGKINFSTSYSGALITGYEIVSVDDRVICYISKEYVVAELH